MTEEWKKIPGWDYAVSSLGQIRNTRSGIIIKGTINHWGHLVVTLSDGTKHKTSRQIGFLVAQAFIPNDFGSKKVKHINKNKLNNKVDNLEWA